MSRFHNYSLNNQALIHLQRPDATFVAGYNRWRDKFSRHVLRGEKGITIIAPTPYKKKIEQEKLDPDTKLPILDADGNTEEVEAESISFMVCAYFGIETGANSFGYVATWSKNAELPEFRASLDTIGKTANGIITDVEKHFAEICRERGVELPKDTEYELVTIPPTRADALAFAADYAVFMNYDYLQSKGVTPEHDGYDAIYTGGLADYGDNKTNLDMIYQRFNVDHPADFKGHSLSVSDIVALKQNGVVSCHYVDSIGFRELPNFLKPENYLKNAEMLLEDDYGMIDGIINNGPKQPTVTELEEQVKAGFSISLMELAAASRREGQEKKKSVLEQLKAKAQEPPAAKTAPKRSAEREL